MAYAVEVASAARAELEYWKMGFAKPQHQGKFVIERNPKFGIIQLRRSTIHIMKPLLNNMGKVTP